MLVSVGRQLTRRIIPPVTNTSSPITNRHCQMTAYAPSRSGRDGLGNRGKESTRYPGAPPGFRDDCLLALFCATGKFITTFYGSGKAQIKVGAYKANIKISESGLLGVSMIVPLLLSI